ncbi:MAG: UDP-N-acetylmuramate--L-alanine ligase [Nitriliruptorales bacterium]|nr:UDP-N-acetylmuramate--L-alanine ligase [Nitriliruptorales bacterium]
MTAPPQLTLDLDRPIHLVGIGGAGMSALASILLQRGHTVTGSDLRGGPAATALAAMGARVAIGHAAEHVGSPALVVTSTAVPSENPEVATARERGIPVVRRAELLAALIGGRRGLLVAGTHGKTTTTSMVTVALQQAGLDPSFAIGGMIHGSGASAHHGLGDIFVAEADESDRSLLVFAPDCAIVTNVELDHHDVYRELDEVLDTFARFLAQRTTGAPAIICADDNGARHLAAMVDDPVVTYGQTPDADLQLTAITLDTGASRCVVVREGLPPAELILRVPGLHNLLNAVAAVAAATWAGADIDAVLEGLSRFGGAQRRFERLGTARGVTVVDDYAHHPTEIVATIAAARQTALRGKLVAVFQPHRYSRTAVLAEELGRALGGADAAVVTDVYPAGEAPEPGVTGQLVADAAAATGVPTQYVADTLDVTAAVAEMVGEGDLVLTLGAGDVTQVGPLLLQVLEGGADA